MALPLRCRTPAEAFVDSPIYARTSGYLTHWYFDMGAHVKQGDLLAEIETPEIDQQLRQARADLDTAKANQDLALTTADRWLFLLQSGSVIQTGDRPGGQQPARAESGCRIEQRQCQPAGGSPVV